MKDILTGNPALPGKPSGPCNMHPHTQRRKQKNISDYVIHDQRTNPFQIMWTRQAFSNVVPSGAGTVIAPRHASCKL